MTLGFGSHDLYRYGAVQRQLVQWWGGGGSSPVSLFSPMKTKNVYVFKK